MTLSPTDRVRADILVDEDRDSLLDLLREDKTGTVYLRSLVHEYGISPSDHLSHGRFYGCRHRGRLTAVAFAGNSRNLTTFGHPEDLEPLMTRVLEGPYVPRLFVGPENHAPTVRRTLFRDGLRARLDRRQAYYVLDRSALPPLEELELRPATAGDMDEVIRAHAAMISEDLTIPKGQLDLARLKELAGRRLRDRKVWVHMDGGRLVFKTEEIARAPEAVLVGGVYTTPAYRGRGFASRGMASWARALFAEGIEALALHVNAGNTPAFRAYERAGFTRRAMLRLILTY